MTARELTCSKLRSSFIKHGLVRGEINRHLTRVWLSLRSGKKARWMIRKAKAAVAIESQNPLPSFGA